MGVDHSKEVSCHIPLAQYYIHTEAQEKVAFVPSTVTFDTVVSQGKCTHYNFCCYVMLLCVWMVTKHSLAKGFVCEAVKMSNYDDIQLMHM